MNKRIRLLSIGLIMFTFCMYKDTYASEKVEEDRVTLEFTQDYDESVMYVGDELNVWYELMKGTTYLNDTVLDDNTKLTSSNKNIVEVLNNFTIIAKKEGKATIRVKNGNVYDSDTIIVKKNGIISEFKSIIIDMPHVINVKGESLNNSDTKVISSNSKVAEVVSYGNGTYLVVGKKTGKVTITVKSADEVKTLKFNVVHTPSLNLVSYKIVLNEEKEAVGYKLKLKNTGKNDITITAGRDGDSYGLSNNKLKKSVTIKPGKTKTITVSNKLYAKYLFDEKGKLRENTMLGVTMEYGNNIIHFWFNENNMLENHFITRLDKK